MDEGVMGLGATGLGGDRVQEAPTAGWDAPGCPHAPSEAAHTRAHVRARFPPPPAAPYLARQRSPPTPAARGPAAPGPPPQLGRAGGG